MTTEATVRRGLKKYAPILLKAREDNLNEADTVQRLIKVFEEVLGYDMLEEISRESQVRDRYVDLALKVEGKIRLLVEAKAAAISLRERHIDQAERYAAEGNHPWVILTNGVEWSLYHLTFEEGVEYVRAWHFDLTATSVEEASESLALIHRTSVKDGTLDDYWQRRSALNPDNLGGALFHEDSIHAIRRVLRRKEGILVDEEDLAKALHSMLTPEARDQIGPAKIIRPRKPRATEETKTLPVAAPEPSTPSSPKQ